ncbi:uncharacterized protein K444DRAFT_381222 [Hyaloscypha bicolor E]|uniref:Uncharacterized protein n=1 Tax=Hyaloscypha bicolor E TaxID=1095630 RepID=A0A2J6TCS9_9HELO|nr:uncharacterized protein K444DRAFT_381222 [Hyaloscypha bicolor E]PMD60835.1 hypothetical protein K444DRAFT_381222 [Hyaloscypha bicolor E]
MYESRQSNEVWLGCWMASRTWQRNVLFRWIIPRSIENRKPSPTTSESSSEPDKDSSPPEPPSIRSILLCISRLRSNYHRTVMISVNIAQVQDDEDLFKTLKRAYRHEVGEIQWWISMRTITRIRFVQFEIDAGSLADIKFFSCEERKVRESLPPEDHPDYLYAPKPIRSIPPVGHNMLLTMYHAPRNGTGRKHARIGCPPTSKIESHSGRMTGLGAAGAWN